MPMGLKPSCTRCKVTQTFMWKKTTENDYLCNLCAGKRAILNAEGNTDSESSKNSSKPNSVSGIVQVNSGPVRKSARLKPTKYKGQYNPKALATKGKSRRVIFKKNPIKAPDSVATIVTQQHIFYDNQYWQVGDIVSVVDCDDGKAYYAQVRSYLQDQYCQMSAVITWLLPTLESSKERFDPCTYILGPEEELPRPMDLFQFVCHAPSDYFKARNSPFYTEPLTSDLAYISSSIGRPEIRTIPSTDEIYGLKDTDAKVPVTKGAGRGKGRGGGGKKAAAAAVKAEKLQQQQQQAVAQQPEIKVEIKEEIV